MSPRNTSRKPQKSKLWDRPEKHAKAPPGRWRFEDEPIETHRAYLKAWREVRAMQGTRKTILLTWAGPLITPERARQEFRDALDKRICARGGWDPPWRKLEPRYQDNLRLDALDLQRMMTERVRIYQFRTPEMTHWFGHLLARRDD